MIGSPSHYSRKARYWKTLPRRTLLIEPFARNSRIPGLMVISNFQTPSSSGARVAHHNVCVLKMLGWRFEGVPSFSSGGFFRRRSEGSVRGRTQRAERQT
jgi:hypothetical protein